MSKRKSTGPTVKKSPQYPWYDDRIATIYQAGSDVQNKTVNEAKQYDTPRKIYDYLDQHIWKQEEAKKAASIIMYHCLRGIKSNAIFVGPTGCGKTHIWRCLKQIFPDRIEIADISCISMDGWKGSMKWKDLFRSHIFYTKEHCILVLDEADKMLAPKYSNTENVSHSIQAEGLTILEGTCVDIKDGSIVREIYTSKISFVLCGAFSNKAQDMAEKSSGSHIGFGAIQETAKPYTRSLEEKDLIEFGVMPEFMGRIQRIVNLEPMTAEDYYQMTSSSGNVVKNIRKRYRVNVQLSSEKRRELAELAYTSRLGVRGMENYILQLVDNALFDDCERRSFNF